MVRARLTHASSMWAEGVDLAVAEHRVDGFASAPNRPRRKRPTGEPLADLAGRTLRALDDALTGVPPARTRGTTNTTAPSTPRTTGAGMC
jgi:hypothetical protein